MIDKLKEFLKYFLVFCLLAFNIFTIYLLNKKDNETKDYLKEIQVKQKQIDDSITRSSSSFVTKDDLDKSIKDSKIDLSKIERDLDSLNGKIESFNKVQVVTVYQKETNKDSTKEIEKKPEEKVEVKPEELALKTQVIDLFENFPNTYVPIGNVGFSHWRKSPWDYEIYKRKYTISNIIAKTDKEETIVYNKFTLNVNDKDYDILINKAETLYSTPENKFHFYPKAFVSSGIGYKFDNSVSASISLLGSFIQYGQYKTNPRFSILAVGIGKEFVGTNMKFTIVPVMYNLNSFTKLINNTYIGLAFSMDTNKTSDISLNLSLSF